MNSKDLTGRNSNKSPNSRYGGSTITKINGTEISDLRKPKSTNQSQESLKNTPRAQVSIKKSPTKKESKQPPKIDQNGVPSKAKEIYKHILPARTEYLNKRQFEYRQLSPRNLQTDNQNQFHYDYNGPQITSYKKKDPYEDSIKGVSGSFDQGSNLTDSRLPEESRYQHHKKPIFPAKDRSPPRVQYDYNPFGQVILI